MTTLYKRQKNFMDALNLLDGEQLTLAKENILNLARESHDLLSAMPGYKEHYNYPENLSAETNKTKLLEEYIDVLKYALGLGHILGFKEHEIDSMFAKKGSITTQKIMQDRVIHNLVKTQKPVIILDFDGVINNYPCDFLNMVAYETGGAIKPDTIPECRSDMHKEVYRNYKDMYYKQSSFAGSRWLEELKRFKDKYTILIYSARPVNLYPEMFLKVHEFTRKEFESPIFFTNLFKGNISSIGLNIKLAIDDDTNVVRTYNKAGINTLTLYNAGLSEKPYKLYKDNKNTVIRTLEELESKINDIMIVED